MPHESLSFESFDPILWRMLTDEHARQEGELSLIASENYASPRVLQAQGSCFTNKYAEGYPGRRYYGGCEVADQVESLAISRARELFGASFANVQPHSGSQANMATYLALARPGDTILGMDLACGGHLTHGARVSHSGQLFHAVTYGVRQDDELLDYDTLHAMALEVRPKIIIAGFSAYARHVDWARFRAIANEVEAYLVADMAHVAGLVAAGVYPSPMPHAHVVTTTTHKTLRGARGGLILTNDEQLAKRINSSVFPGGQGGPLVHVVAAKAMTFLEAAMPEFVSYQRQVLHNASAMARVFQERGHRVVSGGTDNHMFLVDVRESVAGGGLAAETALGAARITVNKNAIPFDTNPPSRPGGIRIGTPAMTTRGLNEEQAAFVASRMCDVLETPQDAVLLARINEEMHVLLREHPIYPGGMVL
jgi:glycine hydroxymethyltransferase